MQGSIMASSQSSSSVVNDLEIDSPNCWCGLKSPLKISHTHKNPGRKYYACPNYYTEEPRCHFFIWEDIFQSVVRENVNNRRENELQKREDALLLREYEAQKEKDKLVEREHMLNKQEGELGRRIIENRIGRILLCVVWIVSLVIGWF